MKSYHDAPRSFDRALDLVAFLRARCDWDARQTPESLIPYLLEEAHEVADAINDGAAAALAGELGDLLLNVAFQTVIAEERGTFGREDVIERLEAKMRRRHPHIYGTGPAVPWEELKARERADDRAAATNATRTEAASRRTSESDDAAQSVLSGLARGLDELSRAQRIQERVSAVGFDWANADGAYQKVLEEIGEVRSAIDGGATAEIEDELGDLLFAVVNLTRLAGAHALRALQRANTKFSRRFAQLESLARARGIELGTAPLAELDRLWDEVKAGES